MEGQETIKSPEKPGRVEVYEHLYPGNKWGDLKNAHASNIGPLIDDMIYHSSVRDTEFGQAVEGNKGYATRIDIKKPDKLTYAYLLLDTTPTTEKPNRGWVSDLINDDENLGGAAQKEIAWVNKSTRGGGMSSIARSGEINQDLYDSAVASVFGVQKDGEPVAIIIHRKGNRPSQGKKEDRHVLSSKTAPSTISV